MMGRECTSPPVQRICCVQKSAVRRNCGRITRIRFWRSPRTRPPEICRSRLLEKRSHEAIRVRGPSLCNPDVQVNHIERFAAFALAVFWPTVASGVIARMETTFAIETKSDLQRHRNLTEPSRNPQFPWRACATDSASVSRSADSSTTTNEHSPLTAIGCSSSTR
jgi:hypothetical protein